MSRCLLYLSTLSLQVTLTGDNVMVLTRIRLFFINFYPTQTAVSIGGNGAGSVFILTILYSYELGESGVAWKQEEVKREASPFYKRRL